MEVRICESKLALGKSAAKYTAHLLRSAIAEKGYARIVLSTGASQFDTLSALVTEDVDWSRVDMFHLDEYVGIPETHTASFRKYLKERFVAKLPCPLRSANFVNGTKEGIEKLTAKLRESEVDVGLIGIGENTHIAFNDPPADFNTRDAYIIVKLDEACRRQQLGEGWFPTFDDVPKQAISMTVSQILKCEHIISSVPYAVKADAIQMTLETPEITPMVPATAMRNHADVSIFIDKDSAAKIDINKYCEKE